MLIFVKELKQLDYARKFGVLMNQRFFDPMDRVVYEEDGTEVEKEVEEFILGKPYISQTVISNPSGTPLQLQVLLDIPKGTIPLTSHEYTQVVSTRLDPFASTSYERFFYAPAEGELAFSAGNACRGDTIIAKAIAPRSIVVKPTHTVNKMESLSDILRSGDQAAVLNFINTKNIFDRNVFRSNDILWLLRDKGFYENVITTLRKRNYYDERIWSFAFYHWDTPTIKELVRMNSSSKIDTSVFEYFPYYSSRTHQFANESKSTIRNVQLKETYLRFLVTAIIGEQRAEDQDVVLAYYLILQDRLRDAEVVLDRHEKNQKGAHSLQVDYMRCFLALSLHAPNFDYARQLVKKYEKDYPIEAWRKLFQEVSKTINAEDDLEPEEEEEKQTEEYQTQVIQEQGQFNIIIPAKTTISVEIFELNL